MFIHNVRWPKKAYISMIQASSVKYELSIPKTLIPKLIRRPKGK